MDNQKIAKTLAQLADLLEFTGANPFRLRAYRNGARIIQDMTDPLAKLVSEGSDLTKLEGVGKSVAEKIKELVETGGLKQLDELFEVVPKSVLDLLNVPKLGPKKCAALFNELGIESLEQLKAACEANQVQALSGFGARPNNRSSKESRSLLPPTKESYGPPPIRWLSGFELIWPIVMLSTN